MSELLRELALPAQQESQLLEVLSAQQDELATAVDALINDRDAMAEDMVALQERHQTEIMAVLDSKYPVFEEYQRNIGEHAQLEEAARLLEAAGVPLRDDQQRRLLEVMVEELDSPRRRPSSIAGAAPEQAAPEEQRAWQDEYEERIRTQVSGALSPEQLKQLNVFWRLQSMQRQRQLEIWNDSTTASNAR